MWRRWSVPAPEAEGALPRVCQRKQRAEVGQRRPAPVSEWSRQRNQQYRQCQHGYVGVCCTGPTTQHAAQFTSRGPGRSSSNRSPANNSPAHNTGSSNTGGNCSGGDSSAAGSSSIAERGSTGDTNSTHTATGATRGAHGTGGSGRSTSCGGSLRRCAQSAAGAAGGHIC